ncbi:MAG: head-tail adaptor protein [Hyphomonadaceae bacterium]
MASAVQRIGALRDRVRIERRAADAAGDGAGNFEGAWAPLLESRAAGIQARRGGEQVVAGRLAGIAVFDIWLRFDADSLKIMPGDRVVDARDESRIFNIRFAESIDDGRKRRILLQCEMGAAE